MLIELDPFYKNNGSILSIQKGEALHVGILSGTNSVNCHIHGQPTGCHGVLLVPVMWHTIRHLTGSADTSRPRINALSTMPCAPK